MARRKGNTRAARPQAPAEASAISAKYDAAGTGRRLRGWNPPASGPNRAIEGLATVRNRARDALRNEWAGASAARVWTTNLIGTGILPRPATADLDLKARLNALWADWCPFADADGVLDFYGLQTLATRNWFASGEIFVRLRARRPEDGLPVPLQLQLLESDMVPLLDLDSAPGLPAGHRIRSGIELDRVGRRSAYWMFREHPGDKLGHSISLADLVRVPADGVLHLYEPLRPGQLRGVSDLAAILVKLRGVMDFDDAVLERQKLANLFTLFITRGNVGDAALDPITGQAVQGYDHDGAPLAALEPGLSQELLPGEDVRFSDPPDAGANYAEFMRQQHLGVAAGQGTPYELLTGDLKDVSDRTLRVIITEFRRHCEQRQWQIIIPQFCQPVREAWAEAAALAGALAVGEVREAKRVTWQPQGWAYIHPVQDAQGKRIEVESGFRSRGSVIAERGDDPDQVDADRAADAERERAAGLVAPTPTPGEPAATALHDGLSHLRASLDAFRAEARERPAAEPVPTVINVAAPVVNVAPAQVTVNNTLPELQPSFEASIQIPEQAAPVIHNQITVEPTPVAIHNEVPAAIEMAITAMPTRQTTTEIERDLANHITTTRQIEADIDAE